MNVNKIFSCNKFLKKTYKSILEIDRDAALSERGDLVANLRVKAGNYARWLFYLHALYNETVFCLRFRLAPLKSCLFQNFFFYFIFISIFILVTLRKATEVLIYRVGSYPDLLLEMPSYCCPLVILSSAWSSS